MVGSTFLTWSGKDPIKLWSDDGNSVEALDESLGVSVLGTVKGQPVFGRSDGGATLWDHYGGHHVRLSAGGYSISKIVRLNNGVIAGVCSPSGQRFDGSHVITWKADGTLVAIWAAGEHLVDITGYYDDRILSWSPDTHVQLWDVNGVRVGGFLHEQRHGRYAHTDDYVMNVFVLQNGSILACSRDGILDVWRENGNLCWSKDLHAELIGHYSDERMYVSAGRRDDIKILDLNGEIVATLPLPSSLGTDTDSLFRCHMMEDGEMVATFLHGALAAWWDSGTVKWYIKAHESTVFQVLRLTNGRLLSLSASGELRLWSREGLPLGDPFRHMRESINGVIRLDNGGIACWSTAGNVSVFLELSDS